MRGSSKITDQLTTPESEERDIFRSLDSGIHGLRRRLLSVRSMLWTATLTACCMLVVAALLVGIRFTSEMRTDGAVDAAGVIRSSRLTSRDEPIRIQPVRLGLLQIPAVELEACCNRIRPPEEPQSVSYYLHVLRLHGLDAQFEHPQLRSSGDILNVLTNDAAGRSLFGASVLVRTRNGVAFMGAGDDLMSQLRSEESHRDQCLAAFAELGIPLSYTLHVDGERFTLSEALNDSVANFHFGQDEIQWTALAYAFYLPPQREWVNKLGERATFDDLVEDLLQLPLSKSSCAGTHVVHTLTVICRVDREHYPILSKEVHDRLHERVARFAAAVVTTQEQDGSWPIDWHRTLDPPPGDSDWTPGLTDPDTRLLVTGHLAEWLLYLPEEFGVPDDCLERAGHWLFSKLKELDEDEAAARVCPYTHAACVLRTLDASDESPN